MKTASAVKKRSPVVLFWREGVARAIQSMWARITEPVTLADLARTAAMSPFHFDRVFRQLTGVRPFQFFAAIRLVKARDLLLSTSAPISDICLDVGYSSLGTFTRRFADQVGAPPLRLRHFSRRPLEAVRPAAAPATPAASPTAQVRVRLVGVPNGSLTFIGAFPEALPVGRPSACALALDGNGALLEAVPHGHHLLAASLPAESVLRASLSDRLLVGAASANPIQASGETVIALRPVEVTDPPIVSFLPLLLREHLDRGTPN